MRHNFKFIQITISSLLIIVVQISHAQPFFKWVDENGATHYTQTPPQQNASRMATLNAPHNANNANNATTLKPINNEHTQTIDPCSRFKATVAEYSNGKRSTQIESNGEVSMMIDGLKIIGARGLAEQYKKYCGSEGLSK